MRKVKVYIAGPYTQGDPAVNTRNACLMADKVMGAGLLPFIPHLCHLWHIISPNEYEYWMDFDLSWLSHCHALLRLPGYSPGADREEALARSLNIPVFHDYFELVAHISLS